MFPGIFILLIAVEAQLFAFPFSANNSVPRILIIHSYQKGLDWTDEIDRGFMSVINETYPEAEVLIEYMDSKRVFDEAYKDLILNLYKYKYTNQGVVFDLILCSDNNALTFLVDYRDVLFGEVPVVFCGVNFFREEMLKGKSLFTGVGETPLVIKETLDLALDLIPDLKSIYAFGAETPSFKANKEALALFTPQYEDRLEFHVFSDKKLSEIREIVQGLPDDSIVLVMGTVEDDNGVRLALQDYPNKILDYSRVPMFASWGYFIGPGCLGGMVITGFSQGQTAAELGMNILKGDSMDLYPPQPEGPRHYKFDYRLLEKFNIDLEMLPVEREIINRPEKINPKIMRWLISGILAMVIQAGIILLLLLNIRNRKQAQVQLRLSEQKFSRVFKTSPDWLIVVSKSENRIFEANEAFYEETGFEEKEILKQKITDISLFEDSGVWQDLIKNTENARTVKNQEISCQGKDQQHIATLWSIVDIQVEDESYYLCVARNITEVEKLQFQLNRAQRMESLGTLAGGVAHDFNNLLQVVLGNADLVRLKVPEDDPVISHIDQIVDVSLLGTDLVRQLLALGQKSMGIPKWLDLNSEADGMIRLLRSTIPKMNEIKFFPFEDLPRLYIDPLHIGQIIMNLTVNASDALPDGGVITIKTSLLTLQEPLPGIYSHLTAGQYIKLSVSDTGIGISREDQERIFDPFFTTKEMGKGTGLGLSTVFSIVKSLKGHISCISEKGEGTVFSILLPVSAEMYESELNSGSLKILPGGGHILIIDDDKGIRETTTAFLHAYGYTVESAANAEEGLSVYRKKHFDLVILDLIMPGMGGEACLKKLLEMDAMVRVIVISGFDADLNNHELFHLGVCCFVSKPFQGIELILEIQKILRHKD